MAHRSTTNDVTTNPLASALRAQARALEAMADTIDAEPPSTSDSTVRLISRVELLDRLGISSPTLLRQERRGLIPSVKIGDTRRYDLQAVLEALANAPPEVTDNGQVICLSRRPKRA